jgi:hypothetical protein
MSGTGMHVRVFIFILSRTLLCPGVKDGENVKLGNNIHLALRLWMCVTLSPHSPYNDGMRLHYIV